MKFTLLKDRVDVETHHYKYKNVISDHQNQSKQPNKKKYGKQWDDFYSNVEQRQGQHPLWEVEAEDAANLDYNIFGAYFDHSLPIVDFGCGTGCQTIFLATKFDQVVGLDVSTKVIEAAQQINSASQVRFKTIDEENPKYFQQLHLELGDANIYMRGVLHQILEDDLDSFINDLSVLAGAKGRIYFVEVANNIRDYFTTAPDNFSQLPGIMKRTFLSHLPPRGLELDDIENLFPKERFKTLKTGQLDLYTNLKFKNENAISIPAVFGIIEGC